jgi:hypothetical protein
MICELKLEASFKNVFEDQFSKKLLNKTPNKKNYSLKVFGNMHPVACITKLFMAVINPEVK